MKHQSPELMLAEEAYSNAEGGMTSRLNRSQIVILRSLMKRGADNRAITIEKWQREPTVPLWRRGIVEIWYRQSPDASPSLQGPFYSLTIAGARLASNFLNLPAPRGPSGAEQCP